MDNLASLAVTGLVIFVSIQTIVTGAVFTYYVWKNLSLVGGVPPEFARKRQELEERRLLIEEETARHMAKMREFSAQRTMEAEKKAEVHRGRIDALSTPGVGLGLVNVER